MTEQRERTFSEHPTKEMIKVGVSALRRNLFGQPIEQIVEELLPDVMQYHEAWEND
ncbi:hypothetical protein [Limimaricola cinnabarinus]|uniref:hypothetical protein n=1 Tax=Limimaricola cinnabarinus TaxID=1125964 RepID=UPI0013A63099|nr:hypothetical protein [Limimaricola cinnabarinus]